MGKINFGVINNYYIFTPEEIKKIKSNVTAEDVEYLKDIVVDSFEDIQASKKSVIYTKENAPEIDKHDYVSLSPYWWPDPEKADGLPYIRRDGEMNPEADLYDKANYKKIGFDMYHLCLLYYFTDDKSYYDLMKKNVYYYFLNPETGMNPNMDHAQTVRGQDNGRCYGIIEYSANMSLTFHLINLLYEMGYVDEEFKSDMNVWVREFLTWMTKSPLGIQERDGNNNHAIYWDFGTVVLCDFLHDDTLIKELYDRVVEYRVRLQITEEGSMPFELYRTRSKNYSIMALKGLYNFSKVASKYGYNLWDNPMCRNNLTNAANYLFDRLIYKKKEWKYMQIVKLDMAYFMSLMQEAARNISPDYLRLDLIDYAEIDNIVSYFLATKLFA